MKGGGGQYYRAVHEIFKASQSAATIKRVLNAVVRNIIEALGVDGCTVLLLDSTRQHLIHSAAQGLSDWYLRKGLLDAQKSLGENLEGKVVEIADATTDPRLQYPALAKQAGIASLLSVPVMKKKGEVLGELRLYTRHQRHFSREEKGFVISIANLTALILENARLTDLVRQSTEAQAEAEGNRTVLIPDLRKPLTFAHPSEEELARLLDFYRIEWLYEPRSFPLQQAGNGSHGMFTPDFYLPEFDLYVELTTSKQRLMTAKHRKIRLLKTLYPQVNIMLLNRKDYSRLLAKYGYGHFAGGSTEDIHHVVFSHAQIQRRVRQLAKQISRDYEGKPLLLIGILKGVVFFMADLMRYISIPTGVDFMAISYYSASASQAVRITKDLDTSVAGMHVLLVEDIVDTGMTLNYVLRHLEAHKPASLKVCTLLDKKTRRLVDVPIAYVGFEISEEFVVGYGLDHKGGYRNLPFVGVLRSELMAEGSTDIGNDAKGGRQEAVLQDK
ncbi:MAG: hypoxanthine phosphoribosyltransferase [Dehalococcoidia bacterium]|nr:hypoxanthine phosphoribosyltransferase [Dehalococcoidia bacterium]